MAEPAEEVGRRRRKKKLLPPLTEPFPEEVDKNLGRSLGPLKRSRPDVYNMLEEYAKQKGRKKTVVMSEALHHFFIERKLVQSQMSLAELYEAWEFLADLQEHAVRNFLRMGYLLFSEEYRGMLELSQTLYGGITPPPPPLPPKAKDIREKLLDKVWKFADPFIDWCMEETMKNFAKSMKVKQPPTLKGVKIPVEIIEEGEEHE